METKVCKSCGRELPLESFYRNYFGITSVCKECNRKNRADAQKRRYDKQSMAEQLNETRKMRLAEFTPLEIMKELARRGYEGHLNYTETHTIDITKL